MTQRQMQLRPVATTAAQVQKLIYLSWTSLNCKGDSAFRMKRKNQREWWPQRQEQRRLKVSLILTSSNSKRCSLSTCLVVHVYPSTILMPAMYLSLNLIYEHFAFWV